MPQQPPQTPQQTPGPIDTIVQAAHDFANAIKSKYGSPATSLRADPNSVIGSREQQMIQMNPQQAAPGTVMPAQNAVMQGAGAGSPQQSYSPEAQSPVSNPTLSMQPPSYSGAGLKGVRRNAGPNGGI